MVWEALPRISATMRRRAPISRTGSRASATDAILPDVAEALDSLAHIESMQGESQLAVAHFEEAIAIERKLGDAWGQAYVLNDLAQHARDNGELERAQGLEEEAHALWVQSGSRMGQRAALLNLSVITFEREELAARVSWCCRP